MIITRLTGGLGNQMFQYAAGLTLADRLRTTCKLDLEWFDAAAPRLPHERYALGCFNVSESVATREEIERARGFALTHSERWASSLARALRLGRWADSLASKPGLRYEDGHRFTPAFSDWTDGTYLHGMWQSESYFEACAALVRAQLSFRYPLSSDAREWAARIRAFSPSVAVHVRRGDYATNPTYRREIGPLDAAYYGRAVAFVRERLPAATLFVFSDDLEAQTREFRTDLPVVFVGLEKPLSSWDTLHLMSLCDHAVIANSTFSWWGAWLQRPSDHHLVVAPSPWFADNSRDGADIVPPRWHILSRSP